MILFDARLAKIGIALISTLAATKFRCNLGSADTLAQHIFKRTLPTLAILGVASAFALRGRFKLASAVIFMQLAIVEMVAYLFSKGSLGGARKEGGTCALLQPDVAVATHRGGRDHFEDRHVATNISIEGYPDAKLLFVFDGHTGEESSQQSSERITGLMSKYLKHYIEGKESYTKADVLNAIKASFADLKSSFEEQNLKDGTTCTGVLLFDGHVWSINLGDSRTIFVPKRGGVINMTDDAKPEKARFMRHTEKYGGEVVKVKRVPRVKAPGGSRKRLAMGASLGDNIYGYALFRRPKVNCFDVSKISPEGTLMVASDGAFDYFDSNTFAELIQEGHRRGASLESLVKALVRPVDYIDGQDNTTILVHSIASEFFQALSGKMVESKSSQSSKSGKASKSKKSKRIALLTNAPDDVQKLVEKHKIHSYPDLKMKERSERITQESAARIRAYRAYTPSEAEASLNKQYGYLSDTPVSRPLEFDQVLKEVAMDELDSALNPGS